MRDSDGENDALIGSTGFVGSNLARAWRFGRLFNSANIDKIRGKTFQTVVCAAPGAEKWKANLDPESDRAMVDRLWKSIESISAGKFILISTVDVYPNPVGVDEESEIDVDQLAPYGRHRRELEQKVADRFDSLIVRLPGLFGSGLKKNALYDLLHKHRVDAIDARAVYQFYDVAALGADLRIAAQAALRLLNIATEPTAIEMIASEVFGVELTARNEGPAPRYDFRTRHAALLGGTNGYVLEAGDVLTDIRLWVAHERGEIK